MKDDLPASSEELASRIFYTAYLGSKHSSKETRSFFFLFLLFLLLLFVSLRFLVGFLPPSTSPSTPTPSSSLSFFPSQSYAPADCERGGSPKPSDALTLRSKSTPSLTYSDTSPLPPSPGHLPFLSSRTLFCFHQKVLVPFVSFFACSLSSFFFFPLHTHPSTSFLSFFSSIHLPGPLSCRRSSNAEDASFQGLSSFLSFSLPTTSSLFLSPSPPLSSF